MLLLLIQSLRWCCYVCCFFCRSCNRCSFLFWLFLRFGCLFGCLVNRLALAFVLDFANWKESCASVIGVLFFLVFLLLRMLLLSLVLLLLLLYVMVCVKNLYLIESRRGTRLAGDSNSSSIFFLGREEGAWFVCTFVFLCCLLFFLWVHFVLKPHLQFSSADLRWL